MLTEKALQQESIVLGRCFLCGGEPSTGRGEHVIPSWLQTRFDISNKRLTLLNGSLLPYRQLTIPCCENCNSNVLGPTEAHVSKLSGIQLANWEVNDSFEVGRWMAKILVGILFKETTLIYDRSQPNSGSIFPPKFMDDFYILHLLVQSWRKTIKFRALHAAHPFTLYVYQLDTDSNYADFNISTNPFAMSICIRFGNLGFAFVGDGGLQHNSAELGPFNLAFQKLYPIQFDEIAARIHYKSVLRDATHLYANSENLDTFNFQQIKLKPYTDEILDDGGVENTGAIIHH